MFCITKYAKLYNINGNNYLFNLNNGSLIKLNEKSFENFCAYLKSKNIDCFDNDERTKLMQQGFLVDNEFDNNQSRKNQITYNLSKFSSSNSHLKIDFAITNKCNFCCPYCFENEILNNNIDYKDLQKDTFKFLLEYINARIKNGLKSLQVVFYGGEPLIEKNFLIYSIKNIKKICIKNGCKFIYSIITNGFLFDKKLIKDLDCNLCDFIQITIDGEKEFHNNRRTNKQKINTFDTIIKNINQLLKSKYKVVIRLNIDKENKDSIKNFINNIRDLINPIYFGKELSIDVARVFGSKNSYQLDEFEEIRDEILTMISNYNLDNSAIGTTDLNAFCMAETLNGNLVLDAFGNVYRCWNNVFNNTHIVNNIKNIVSSDNNFLDFESDTLDFVHKFSLQEVNNGECFNCEYVKYCQGLCPSVRKNIIEKKELNIYNNGRCKEIIDKRINSLLKRKLEK